MAKRKKLKIFNLYNKAKVFKIILSNLDPTSQKKLILLILSNLIIGILEMISFSSIYIYIKFILFDELILKNIY